MEMMLKSNEEVHEKKLPKLHVETSILEEQQEKEQGFHVLAVDDSLIDRKLLEKLLKISSYEVTCVESGDKALEYLGLVNERENNSTSISMSVSKSTQQEGMKVNLIMTDFCMPGMSGYDLLKRVKGSSWKDVPVVIMSSENIPSRINMCLEEGAEEFLLKPVQLSDVEKLQSHLKKSNLHNFKTTEEDYGDEDFKANDSNSNSSSSCDDDDDDNNSSSSSNKRKALSSSESTERRPKIKGLAVV